jgi:hypothetical protein
MSKARELINDDDSPVTTSSNIIKFEPPATPQRDQDNAKLKAEIQALRLELAKAQRTIAHYETLVHNGLVREYEIRAALVKRPS